MKARPVPAPPEVERLRSLIGAKVLDDELPVGQAHEAFDARGTLVEAGLRDRLAGILDRLVEAVPGEHRHVRAGAATVTRE